MKNNKNIKICSLIFYSKDTHFVVDSWGAKWTQVPMKLILLSVQNVLLSNKMLHVGQLFWANASR